MSDLLGVDANGAGPAEDIVDITIIGAGLAGSLAFGQTLRTQLYATSPTDPATAAVTTALMATAALLACFVAARRAARIDPHEALRQQ